MVVNRVTPVVFGAKVSWKIAEKSAGVRLEDGRKSGYTFG